MLGADNALDKEPVHSVQDDGTDVDEDIGHDGESDVPGIVGPRYPQGHGDDSNLAETCNVLAVCILVNRTERTYRV